MEVKRPAIMILTVLLAGISGPSAKAGAAKPLVVASPDGNLTISFALKANPQPYLPGQRAYYRVSYKNTPILTDSPLGLDFLGASALDQDFEVVGTDRKSQKSTWENPFGAKRTVPDNYNQLTVSLHERRAPGRRVDLIFRAYDEGVALRYFLPKQEGMDKFALASENTGFYFAREVSACALNMGRFNTHNEGEYLRMSLSDIKPASVINLPLLAEIPGGPWVALLEADLRDYAGMFVGGVPGIPHALVSKLALPPRNEELARTRTTAEYHMMEQPVLGTTPKTTPWRVLMIGPTPGRLIETNYLILNLNPPCALADTSWIKPGKAVWPWWSNNYAENVTFKPGNNTATNNHYIDFAAANHFEYIEVAETWPNRNEIIRPIPDIDYEDIFGHAKQLGVKIILWVPWAPFQRQIDEVLPLYQKWGVSGIKVDLMNRDDQEIVNYYEEVARKTAQYKMVVYMHGAYKPTGMQRTYPNIITQEGVLGLEYDKWSNRAAPEHDVTLPFTRMLAGHMDYTPGGFRNATREQFRPKGTAPMTLGTRAHQLAMYAIYEMPLAMVADYPEAYRNQPGLEFIAKVPTVWDESEVLAGRPAEFIVMARQHGSDWYVGAMTNWEARDLEVPLNFLGDGEYEAQIFADGPDASKVATSLSITKKRVKAGDKLAVHLAPGGGLAVILSRVSS